MNYPLSSAGFVPVRFLVSGAVLLFSSVAFPEAGFGQDLEALLSKPDVELRAASPETVVAYEQLLATLQNSNMQEGYRQAQAFVTRLDFVEPEQKRLASLVLKIAVFRQQLQADLPQLAEWQKLQAAEEQTVAALEVRRRQLKAQYDVMPKVVTANGAAHTRIKQMEKEYDAAAVQLKERQNRADSLKKQTQDAVTAYATAFRAELISFLDELKTKNRFREILALTNCYTSGMGQDPALVTLAQDALENERAYRESVKIVESVMAKVAPLTARGALREAVAEIERSEALIESKLREARVKGFALARLSKERGQVSSRLLDQQQQQGAATAAMESQRNNRFAIIASTIANDPWEAEKMLARLAADDSSLDEVAALRAKVTAAKRERAGQALGQVHQHLDEAQAFFEKISTTMWADLRRGDTERVTALIQGSTARENFVRAVSLLKAADAQLQALPAAELDPLQRADLAGLKANTASSLEMAAKVK